MAKFKALRSRLHDQAQAPPPAVGFTPLSRPRSQILGAFVAGFLVLAGGLLVSQLRAAIFFVAADPENGTVTTNAKQITDTTAIGGRAVQFTAPAAPAPPPPPPTADCINQVWQQLVVCGWPGPANTGYPSGQTFTNTSGRTITADNTVIDGQKITGQLVISAKNVVIRNSWLINSTNGAGGSNVVETRPGSTVTFDRTTIYGSNNTHLCILHMGASLTATGVNCYGVNDGIMLGCPGGNTSPPCAQLTGDNFTIQDSYLHDFTTNAANGHIDGIQTEGVKNGVIKHNTINVNSDQTGAVSIWNSMRSSDNILVENNLMAGGGFTIYAEDYSPSESSPAGGFGVTRIKFINNRFSTVRYGCVGFWGVWYPRGNPSDGWSTNAGSTTTSVRSGNIVLETNKNIDTGNPSYNGAVCN